MSGVPNERPFAESDDLLAGRQPSFGVPSGGEFVVHAGNPPPTQAGGIGPAALKGPPRAGMLRLETGYGRIG